MDLKKFGYKKAFVVTTVLLFILLTLNLVNTLAMPGPFTIPKPYTADLVPEIVFTIDSMSFDTGDYGSCAVVVSTTHSGYTATVTISLKEGTTEICDGSASKAVTANIPENIQVPLTWDSGKTITDVDSGTVHVVAS